MSQDDKWRKIVFRVRGLPIDVKHPDDVASLLSVRLGDIPSHTVKVYSLATALDFTSDFSGSPRSRSATVMFETIPSLVQNSPGKEEWSIPAQSHQSDEVVLDTHFIGMTPLNDVESNHLFE